MGLAEARAHLEEWLAELEREIEVLKLILNLIDETLAQKRAPEARRERARAPLFQPVPASPSKETVREAETVKAVAARCASAVEPVKHGGTGGEDCLRESRRTGLLPRLNTYVTLEIWTTFKYLPALRAAEPSGIADDGRNP